MPKIDGMFEDDGFYCLKICYDLKDAADRKDFEYLMSPSWACDHSDLHRALNYYGGRYVEVTARLARRTYFHGGLV